MASINGSDLLLKVGGKAVGHCTSHTITYTTETKETAVKPVASKPKSKGLFKDKEITGLAISLQAEGLQFYEETENGAKEIAAQWGAGDLVDVESFERESDTSPMYKGKCVIDSLENTAPAGDTATYSVQLSNSGEPEVYPGKTQSA